MSAFFDKVESSDSAVAVETCVVYHNVRLQVLRASIASLSQLGSDGTMLHSMFPTQKIWKVRERKHR